MLKRCCAAFLAAIILIFVTGVYYRSRLDAISGASRTRLHQVRKDAMYVFCVNPRSPLLRDPKLKNALFRAVHAEPLHPIFFAPRLRVAYDAGEAVLAAQAKVLRERLERNGIAATLSPCSPVMLRSKLLAGACEIALAPRRVILRSDIERLGAKPLHLPEGRNAL